MNQASSERDAASGPIATARSPQPARRLPLKRIIFLVIVLLGLWSTLVEPNMLVVHRETIAVPGWAPRRPLRIALAGDLHVGSPFCHLGKVRKAVQLINDQHPDVIVLLGDYVIQEVLGGEFISPEQTANELRALHAPLGVYAVLGNHDAWLDSDRVARALRSANIVVLQDESRVVGQDLFALAGVGDFWTSRHDIGRALAGVTNSALPIILITHNPDLFPQILPRVSLTLAAHTHGGQVNLPFVGRLIVPSAYGQRFAAGHIVERGRHLFVTTGVGMSILPVRFRVPPEVAVLEVK